MRHSERTRVLRFAVGVLLATAAAASPTGASTHSWRWPVDPHRVVRVYEAPASRYGASHRGIDLDVRPGQDVFAPTDGVVSFAGTVVDRPLVSVQLADGVLVTVEPVQPSVRAGTAVRAGTLLGVVGAGGHCGSQCLHLGVRVHGAYVSPALFLGGLPRAVLLPLDGDTPGQARGWAVR